MYRGVPAVPTQVARSVRIRYFTHLMRRAMVVDVQKFNGSWSEIKWTRFLETEYAETWKRIAAILVITNRNLVRLEVEIECGFRDAQHRKNVYYLVYLKHDRPTGCPRDAVFHVSLRYRLKKKLEEDTL